MATIIILATIVSFFISYAIHYVKLLDAVPYVGKEYIDEFGNKKMENNHVCNIHKAKGRLGEKLIDNED